MSLAPLIFDRKRVRAHRDRAAADFAAHRFLLDEMAERLCDRLSDVTRQFPRALDMGSHGAIAQALQGRGGIETLVQSDLSAAMLSQSRGFRVVADEEFLPFAEHSFDLVMSMSLHWVNDLPGALIQINRILKPDGLLLAMLPGGQTLYELRASFEQAELALSGGLSPRISPFVDVRDAGSLLQRAGFALPVVDSELLTVSYEEPLKLLRDVRGMGESNALYASRKNFTRRSIFVSAAEYYRQHFTDENGRIPATFELVTLTGWKPHASQQKPARRGSGQVSLTKIL